MRHTKKLLIFIFITITLVVWAGLVKGQRKVTPKLVWEYHSDTPIMLNFSLEKSYPYPVSAIVDKQPGINLESLTPKLFDRNGNPIKTKVFYNGLGEPSQNFQYMVSIPEFISRCGEDMPPNYQMPQEDYILKCFDVEGNVVWSMDMKEYIKELEKFTGQDIGLRVGVVSDDGSKVVIGYSPHYTYGPYIGYSVFDSKQGEVFRINYGENSEDSKKGLYSLIERVTLDGNYLVIRLDGKELINGVRVYSLKSKKLIFKKDIQRKPGQGFGAKVKLDYYIEFWSGSEEEHNFGIMDSDSIKWIGRYQDYYPKTHYEYLDKNKIIWIPGKRDPATLSVDYEPIIRCTFLIRKELLWQLDFSKLVNEKVYSVGWGVSPTKTIWSFISISNKEMIIILFNEKGEKISEPVKINHRIKGNISFSKDGKYLYENERNRNYWVFSIEE